MTELPAIAGGPPVRDTFLPYVQPTIGVREETEVVATLRSGWLGPGRRVTEFENLCKEFIGADHAVAANSATAALNLALIGLGIGPGDLVFVPCLTWPATVNAVYHTGADVYLVDVRPDTLNLDPESLAVAIELARRNYRLKRSESRPRAIIPVHFAGQPCDMAAINTIAKAYELLVIEDAAHAFGARTNLGPVGTFADATVFSFHATKIITSIEGGLLCTPHRPLAEQAYYLRAQGVASTAWQRFSGSQTAHPLLTKPGFKYEMSDVCAAVGTCQLGRLPEFVARRREHVLAYRQALGSIEEVRLLEHDPTGRSTPTIMPILVQTHLLSADRDTVVHGLRQENIGTGLHYIALHLHPYFRRRYGDLSANLPVGSTASAQLISLPLFAHMVGQDRDDVIRAFFKVIEYYRRDQKAA